MNAWLRLAFAVVALAAAVAVDIRFGQDAMMAMPYAVIVLLGLWWNSPNMTLVLAVAATIGALAAMVTISPQAVDGAGNRGVGLLLIWVVALAVMLRQRADARLSLRASFAEGLMNHAPAQMFVRDLDSRYLLMNQALRQLRNISVVDVVGTPVGHFFSPEEADRKIKADQHVIVTGMPQVDEIHSPLPDGSIQIRRVNRFPIRNDSGAVVAVGGVSTDISELRRAERALQENEALLRAFLDNMPGLLSLKDTAGRFLLVNQELKDWFGLSDEDVLGKTADDLFPGRPLNAMVEEHEQRVLSTGAMTYHDAVVTGTDGRTMNVLFSKFPVANAEGTLIGIGSIALDFTERRHIEAALRQSEANHRSLIDESFVGIFIYRDNKLLYANQALTKLFGRGHPDDLHTVDEILAMVVHHDRDRVRRFISLHETERRGTGIIGLECRRRDGEVIWVDLWSHAMSWEGKDAHAVLLLDKTGNRRAETQLRDAIEGMTDGLVIYDGSDRVALFNGTVARWWDDVSGGVAIGMTYEQHMRALINSDLVPEKLSDGRDWLQARLEWHADPRGSFEYQRADGLWMRVTERRSENSGTVAVIMDITESRRREADLRHGQKMEAIGELTGGVAHDFNNLLSVILGNLELAGDNLAPGTASIRFVDNAAEAARRGAALTQRLLAFSRKQALEPRVLDVRVLLSGMADMLTRTLGETIDFEVVNASGLWSCRADPAQLENAILNLAINARDAMPNGGNLTIEIANTWLDDHYPADQNDVQPGQYVQISVTDSGTGMAAEIQSRAFEPFFTTKDVGQGSGLGLSMVYGFAKQSGGHLSIYSVLGEGTTVKIYLPRECQSADAPVELAPEDDLRGNGEVVMVVEDDADVRAMVVDLLHGLDYRALEAADGADALKVAEEATTSIDLLLTDVVLPGGMNGRDLANQITSLRPQVQVLFMSGYSENAIIHHGHLDDGVALLQKPFGRRELARNVHRALFAP